MCIREIDHVDVVTQARSVRRRIVLAKDRDMVAFSERHLQNERDEMRLRRVILTDRAVGECPRRIEVAQGDIAHTVRAADPLHHLLHRELCLSVRIRRVRLVVLVNGNALRLAVDGRRRGEDNLVDAMAHHRLEEHLHPVDIVVEIEQGLFDTLPHEGVRRKVDDRLDLVLRENLIEHRRIANISLIERGRRVQRPTVPRLEIVHDHDLLALFHQCMNGMRADVSCAAADQNSHVYPSPFL